MFLQFLQFSGEKYPRTFPLISWCKIVFEKKNQLKTRESSGLEL